MRIPLVSDRPIRQARILVFLAATLLRCAPAWSDNSSDPNTREMITTGTSKEELPKRALLRLGTKNFRPDGATTDLAISRDDKFIISLGRNLSVWDAETGNELWSISATDHGLYSSNGDYGDRAAVLGHSSDSLLTTGPKNEFIFWSIASGQKTSVKLDHGFEHVIPAEKQENLFTPATFRGIDVSIDGSRIALSSALGVIIANRNGNVLATFKNQPTERLTGKGPVPHDRLTYSGHYSIGRFSPNGKELALLTSDSPTSLKIVDLSTFAITKAIPLSSWLVRMAFSSDGVHIATIERDETVRLYDVATSQQVWSHKIELHDLYENYLSGILFSPDGAHIAVAATDKSIYLLDSKTGNKKEKLVGHKWAPRSFAFSSDSKLLYSSGGDAIIRRWDVSNGVQIDLPNAVYVAGEIAASSVSDLVAFNDDRGAIQLVDSSKGSPIHTFNVDSAEVSAIKFSLNGALLGAGGRSGDQLWVAIWDLQTFERQFYWKWPRGDDLHTDVTEVAFSSDLTRFASAVFRQGKAYLWDLSSGKQVAVIPHRDVYGVSFSPTEPLIATGGWDSMVRIWNSQNGERQAEIDIEQSMNEKRPVHVYHVCYSPDGRFLAVGHDGLSISLWSTQSMELRSRFKFHPSGGWGGGDMNFSPNGLWLCSADMSSTVKLWDPYSGQKIMDVSKPGSTGSPVEFGAHGRTLVSGQRNGACYVWDISTPAVESAPDIKSLWKAFNGSKATDAYDAFWSLAKLGDQAVSLLAEKLGPIESVLDTYEMTKTLSLEETSSRDMLVEKLTLEDKRLVRIETLRRSVWLLAQIGTEDAVKLLKELSKDVRNGKVREEAQLAIRAVSMQTLH